MALAALLLGAAGQPCAPPGACRYAADNAALVARGERPKVVFLGDSITEGWRTYDPGLFGAGAANRGISGETTAQMLARFDRDVVALRPAVLHLMGGTNDVAGNGGAVSNQAIVANITAMIDRAEAAGIHVVLASIPPAAGFPWAPDLRPAGRIRQLNIQLRALAAAKGTTWVDYHARLADRAGGMPKPLAADGVHPGAAGYARMRPLAERAIRDAGG